MRPLAGRHPWHLSPAQTGSDFTSQGCPVIPALTQSSWAHHLNAQHSLFQVTNIRDISTPSPRLPQKHIQHQRMVAPGGIPTLCPARRSCRAWRRAGLCWLPGKRARLIAWDKFMAPGGFPGKAASTLVCFLPYPGEHVCNHQPSPTFLSHQQVLAEKNNKILDIPEGKDVFQAPFGSKGPFSAHIGLPKINTKMQRGSEARAVLPARAKRCCAAPGSPQILGMQLDNPMWGPKTPPRPSAACS